MPNQLSNTARLIILFIALLALTIVSSAKADMVKATYSPYKCSMDNQSVDTKISLSFTNVIDTVIEELPQSRKFNFKNKPVKYKIEGVRHSDVTSSKPRLLLTIKIPECELPVYKII